MKKIIPHFFFSALLLLPMAAGAQTVDAESETEVARAAADPWLIAVDEGRYEDSWSQAAPIFQEGITAEQWAERMGQTRTATGDLVARRFSRAQYTTDLPNAPAGEYVLVEYATQFSNVPAAEEAVILRKLDDGSWKVAGAFVRPAQ